MRKSLEKNAIISPSSLLPSSSIIEIRIQAGPTKIIQNIFVKYLAHLRLIVCAQLKVLALSLYVWMVLKAKELLQRPIVTTVTILKKVLFSFRFLFYFLTMKRGHVMKRAALWYKGYLIQG